MKPSILLSLSITTLAFSHVSGGVIKDILNKLRFNWDALPGYSRIHPDDRRPEMWKRQAKENKIREANQKCLDRHRGKYMFECPDGTWIKVRANEELTECIWPRCPDSCKAGVKVCSDSGVKLKRSKELDCEFPKCPPANVTTTVERIKKMKSKPRKKFPGKCPKDRKPCNDGSWTTRKPELYCEFEACST